jgi:hypothetical protein
MNVADLSLLVLVEVGLLSLKWELLMNTRFEEKFTDFL